MMRYSSNSSKRVSGFSLIEILVVVGVMAVLLAMSAPALLSNRGSAALGQAGGIVADLALLARENAMARNQPTALIVVRSNAPAGLDGRALTLLEMGEDRMWRQATQWRFLPDAIGAVDATAGGTATFPVSLGVEPLVLRGDTVNLEDCDTYVFLPAGRMPFSGAPAKIRIEMETNLSNFYELVFNDTTGTFQVIRP